MSLSTLVIPDDIAVALGQGAPAPGSVQYRQWSMWIDDALMLIDIRAGELAVATIDQARIDYVVREAVVSHQRHPEDSTQVSVSVDDGSVSKSYRSGAGRVRISDDWWALLGLTPSGGGAFDVDTAGSGSCHQPWCSLALGALYCSCGADLAGFPLWEA